MICFGEFFSLIVKCSLIFSSNPKKRYQLFLKATQLDVIIEKLDQATVQINVAKTKYKAQQRQHGILLDEQKKAQEKLNQFKSMEPLRVSATHKKNIFHWFFVNSTNANVY